MGPEQLGASYWFYAENCVHQAEQIIAAKICVGRHGRQTVDELCLRCLHCFGMPPLERKAFCGWCHQLKILHRIFGVGWVSEGVEVTAPFQRLEKMVKIWWRGGSWCYMRTWVGLGRAPSWELSHCRSWSNILQLSYLPMPCLTVVLGMVRQCR